MREQVSDLFVFGDVDAICITTNGSLVRDARGYRGVMGRGVAWQAKNHYPSLERRLGESVHRHGLHVAILDTGALHGRAIVAFPVKHRWQEPADLALIQQSAEELVKLSTLLNWQRVVLPRPGCGNGQLTWDVVQPVLAPLLDDRFLVVTL